MPRRSVSLLSAGWQENGPYALHNRHCSMKKARATLDRVLSKAGIASRATTREWIGEGRVKVNGRVIRNPDHWVETVKDVVHLDGLKIREEKKIYVALNKPGGVVTSFGDNRNRPTVYDYIKKLDRWVFPVGRLDMDTSGLLILTNDTQYGEALLQPESKIPKTYYVKAASVFAAGDYFDLAYGLDIGRGETSGRAIVREVRVSDKYTWFELTITEGKNRQVRRMCDAIGHAVLKLVRIRIGDLSLGDLPVGQFKVLNHEEAQKALQK
ncbi:MAG: rRNA pseudouridine synthase [Acidobacteria bacterium]|nr:MAG: rRNA pseudouridine synthase [Acidobacteriota bacterium]